MTLPFSLSHGSIARGAQRVALAAAAVALAGVLCAGSALAAAAFSRSGDDPPLRFDRDIRPLLSDRCFHCHGPDAETRRAKLRLDRPDGDDGAYRTRKGRRALVPGSLDESTLWKRVSSEDDDRRMPPADSHKQRLRPEELDRIKRWIEGGAEYEAHWAFVPPRPADDAPVEGDRWSRNEIDRIVLRAMRTRGLAPSEEAARRTLLRRLSVDLTGLPPTRAELRAFLEDAAPDAYEKQVERLLASPRYGEHMARAWLDLVRFADTNGVHHDHYREMSPYRDWVIRAFNANLPFDQFITDQVAGDLHEAPTRDQRIASGFNRLHLIIDVGTALPEESHVRNVVDRVSAVGTAFLGLTLQCAVCHDHKYDPIQQRDFYGLYAFFNSFDGKPETGGRRGTDFRRGLQKPYINLTTPEQEKALNASGAELEVVQELIAYLNGKLAAKGKAMPAQRGGALRAEKKRLDGRARKLRATRDAMLMKIPAAMVMRERSEPRPAHILIRGEYDKPGERVQRSTPAFLPPLRRGDKTEGSQPTRMDLARWLVSAEHPLTARVAVNRFWQQLFGVGLVKTSEDFGLQGEAPSHPALLDALALRFQSSGWNVKALLRRIVLSATYRQSAKASADSYARDPENRWLARGARFRMDAEVLRDQILATSGLLNAQMFGKSVKPPQPEGIWKAVTLPSSFPRSFKADSGDKIYRRSVYTFWKRALPPPQMTIFGAPTREFCTARRERTNTPLQALLLWNEQEYLRAARHLARRVTREAKTPSARVRVLYEAITSQVPDADETRALLESVADLLALYRSKPELASKLCAGLSLTDAEKASEVAAWTMLTSTIYNLDITKTRQ